MADTVQYHLERMVPELEDLEKRGLFTRKEIKAIVKKRSDFEYLLKRHSTDKRNFFQYVEYEQKLEALRRLRKKALVRDLKGSGGEKWNHSLCDKASSMRIVQIFERALTRYKGDLNLWLQYLEYCKDQAPRKMQKAATKCLQLHPKVPGLWMYTAAWEFEHRLNVKAARALMQRGLRICSHAENLWLEYFRMELTYMQKLKARRVALGLEMSRGKQESKGDEEEAAEVANNEDDEDKVPLEDKLSYKLAQSVYRNAVAAIPSSLGFRQQFVEALDAFEFDSKKELEVQIHESITNDFPADENSWDWLARRHVESETRAIEVFEDALEAHPSARMYELYANYLADILDAETLVDSASRLGEHEDKIVYDRHDVASLLHRLYDRALAAGVSSEKLAKGHLEFFLRRGRLDEALDISRKFCDMVQLKGSASVWEWRMELEMNRSSSTDSDDQDREAVEKKEVVLKLFQESVKSVPLTEAKRLWVMVLNVYRELENYTQVVFGMLEKVLSGGAGGRDGADLACTCLKWIHQSQGIKKARQTYLRFLGLPGPSAEFFRACIAIESQNVRQGCTASLQHLRKLFNDAVELFGQHDAELWIEYCRMELKAGNVDAADTVYWRAKKALKDPTDFIEKHQLL
ncbi:unnamed protein product [Calypogeia fissa]